MADSYNELFGLGSHSEDANLEGWWPLQDDAASTAVDDVSSNGRDGTLVGGDNTSALSATGPNSWLTKALHFNGSDDYVDLPDAAYAAAGGFSIVCFCNPDIASGDRQIVTADNSVIGNVRLWQFRNSNAARQLIRFPGVETINFASAASAGVWDFAAAVFDGAGDGGIVYDNDSEVHDSDTSDNTATSGEALIAARWAAGGTTDHFDGLIANAAIFSRALSAAEVGQVRLGPEPINSVAPALSGTETEDETLSVTTGTWGLDSPFSAGTNGTITYSYQWTRSDDAGGTGEADIGGATSNTYTLTGDDVGSFIRCRVRATNDGGFDADADTNSDVSGEIQSAASAALPPLLGRMFTGGMMSLSGGLS